MRSRVLRPIPATVAGLAAAIALSTVPHLATAAELTTVELDVTVSPTSLDPGDTIRTDLAFCLPDSAVGGDTFSVSLAEQLTQLPSSISLNDPDGNLVAVAAISGVPAVATFTLSSYVDDRVDVCGTAFFESQLSGSVTPNSVQTLRFVLSGGAVFDTDVTVGASDVGVVRTTARKSGVFSDSGDQCRTTLDSCLSWFVESRPGPFASVTITDDGLVDGTFECATLSVRLWTLNPDGSRGTAVLPGDVGASISQVCTPSLVDVSVSNVPAGVIVRSLVTATPTLAETEGGVTFTNVASVTHVAADATTTTDTTNGQVRNSTAGGEASGVVPPTSTSTTTSAPTTTSPDATTTTEASGGVTPPTSTATTTTVSGAAATTSTVPRLPATGRTNGSFAMVGLLCALAGVGLVTASRRRSAG